MEPIEHFRPKNPNQSVILLVDDEPMVRNLVRLFLEESGFFILTASHGEEALQLSHEYPGRIDALVTDIMMPKLDGVALREQILIERPAIKTLFMSGQCQRAVVGVPFLAKPFKREELIRTVKQLFTPLAAKSAAM